MVDPYTRASHFPDNAVACAAVVSSSHILCVIQHNIQAWENYFCRGDYHIVAVCTHDRPHDDGRRCIAYPKGTDRSAERGNHGLYCHTDYYCCICNYFDYHFDCRWYRFHSYEFDAVADDDVVSIVVDHF